MSVKWIVVLGAGCLIHCAGGDGADTGGNGADTGGNGADADGDAQETANECDGGVQSGGSVLGQADLAAYEGVRELSTPLLIHSQPEDPVTSLDALRCLERIGGNLEIYNTALTELEGLNKLEHVASDLLISSNGALLSLEGLEGLKSVGGVLRVNSNKGLTDLTGLNNVDRG